MNRLLPIGRLTLIGMRAIAAAEALYPRTAERSRARRTARPTLEPASSLRCGAYLTPLTLSAKSGVTCATPALAGSAFWAWLCLSLLVGLLFRLLVSEQDSLDRRYRRQDRYQANGGDQHAQVDRGAQ